jgi:cell division protein FtsN
MLPLVGLVAIGLLLVAGKIFFFSDFQGGVPPIPETIAPPGTPRSPVNPNVPRADAGVGLNKPLSGAQPAVGAPLASPQRAVADGNLILDLGQSNKAQAQEKPVAAQANQNRTESNKASATTTTREEIKVVSTPSPQARPVTPAAPKPEPQSKPAPKPAELRPAAPRPAVPRQPRPAQPNQTQPEKTVAEQTAKPNWMVQIGAFSTRAAADNVVNQVTQAGHTANVLSGTTLHRVLIQAGPTKQDALNLATRMGQSGFPGAFVIPPRP